MLSPVKIWRNQKKTAHRIGERGKIVTWTMIFVPLGSFAHLAPYPVVVVLLDSGERITAQLVDYSQDQLVTDQSVELVLRRVTDPAEESVIPYNIKARPI